MRIAVCILHYGKAELTERLHTQFVASDPAFEADIHVLDNASPEPYPGARQRMETNLYWGGALAWALDAFGREGYTHLWFCNNDFVFVSEPPYLARAAARMRWLEKKGRLGLYSPSATANPYHAQMVERPGNGCRDVPYIDGIAPVISLDCAAHLGGLDLGGNPYGYGVDVWLSLRAARAGWGVWVDDSLVLRHAYHAAARDEAGFLRTAAVAENAYLTERIGTNWRESLLLMQTTRENAT